MKRELRNASEVRAGDRLFPGGAEVTKVERVRVIVRSANRADYLPDGDGWEVGIWTDARHAPVVVPVWGSVMVEGRA